jgi:hypothetical protein
MKERPGSGPLPLDGGRRDLENVGCLFDGQSAEEAQFHNAALLDIEPREIGQRIVQGHHLDTFAVQNGYESASGNWSPPSRFEALRFRAQSTRICRMISAASPKNCLSFSKIRESCFASRM